MNSENACQTSTGNYTTPGMSQQCRTLEAIQKSLAYCAFVVTQRYFHSSSPTSQASALTVFTLVLLFSLTHCRTGLWKWRGISAHCLCNLMTNRHITCKCNCLPFFNSAEATATDCCHWWKIALNSWLSIYRALAGAGREDCHLRYWNNRLLKIRHGRTETDAKVQFSKVSFTPSLGFVIKSVEAVSVKRRRGVERMARR